MFLLALALVLVGNVYSQSNNKIIGGSLANIEDYPYQVSYQLNGVHKCGGVILNNNVVITAAHCYLKMNSSVSSMTIRAGSSMKSSGGQVVGVQRVCRHLFFTFDTLDYDIALLKLSQPLNFSSTVQSIPLISVNQELPDDAVGTATGWGQTQYEGSSSEQLRVVQLPVQATEVCSLVLALFHHTITDRMVCFGATNNPVKDTCQGDSGGPLVFRGILVGITSFGVRCGMPSMPSVYTKISNSEINQHIRDCLVEFANS